MGAPVLQPRSFTLKDGRPAIIRAVRRTDAAALLECERTVIAAGVGTVRAVSQLAPSPRARRRELREWTDGPRGGDHGALLVCELHGGAVIAGSGSISRMAPARLAHVARIGVGVAPAYQGLGVGRQLMSAMLDWGRSNTAVGRIELGVFATNRRAIALYESLGFVIEGTRRGYVRFEDGSTCDDHLMALLLQQ